MKIIRTALLQSKLALTHDLSDCWAMGPTTGDIIEDYVVCPGCRALNSIELALKELEKIENKGI